MNILFPIAGKGQRFKFRNQFTPKPLVTVNGKTLLEHAVSTLEFTGQYIFVALKYDDDSFNKQIRDIVFGLQPQSKLILLDVPTQGMAETCLCAEHFIDTSEKLIITNVDQYLSWDSNDFLNYVDCHNLDACVSTYDHHDIEVGKPSKYAFVELDDHEYATRFVEKFAISKHAMNGIYYWKCGQDFVRSAKQMIADDIRTNGEYYVSPSFNYMIRDGKRIKTYKMKNTQFYSLGSPEEIEVTLQHLPPNRQISYE